MSARALPLVVALAACGPDKRPWEAAAGSGDALFAPRPIASATASVTRLEGPATEHERCTAGYVASGDPVRDVTRLALSCGGATGMRRTLPQAVTGTLGDGAVELAVQAKRGRCYRVFAAAAPAALELGLALRTSRDATVAEDRMKGPLAFLGARAPVCGLDEGELTVVVTGSAKGRFAVEVWDGPDRAEAPAPAEPLGSAGAN